MDRGGSPIWCATTRSAFRNSGFGGEKVAVIGANRPRLCGRTAIAVARRGAVPVYKDSVADLMAYVLEHAEVAFVVAEARSRSTKVLSVARSPAGAAPHDLRRQARL